MPNSWRWEKSSQWEKSIKLITIIVLLIEKVIIKTILLYLIDNLKTHSANIYKVFL